MSHQPLTLQYRPVDFKTVVGQDHITSVIREQIAHDAAKANYLFFGPRGTGKTSTARIVAKALNCLNPDHGNPCNQCANCLAIAENRTLDIVEIDAASHTGVDNVREEIIAKVPYQPSQLKKKVYIIDEVHMLSKGAFNALLKVMEEPPSYVTFILATTEIHKVPETIVSRCQSFQFSRVARDAIVERLQTIADAEGIKTESDALWTIAKVSEGIMRDAVKYLDQVSVLGDVTSDRVQSFLGMVDDEKIAALLGLLHNGDVTGAIEEVTSLQASGVDLAQFAKQVLAYVDEHFLDDVEQMTMMAGLFGKILGEMKYYPYPLLVYKRYFGERMREGEKG
ncbi:MAG: DNA polymerase III subunit gamma/tau [Candidatus Peribacteria bacterium]|nr:MAG: DNA polymerase III subunit gamma/tau [Candidatus Peribacteria bacterium]